ncbi:MAG: GTP cyclohydrolase 1 type 2 [Gemmatales bacterium]|nr:MAG: GTP cyclohydrolase 1 type 2 [Gemmatales bacterium]
MITVQTIIDHLEEIIPLRLASEGDNVGLLLGDSRAKVKRIMTCLTVTPESVAEAVEQKADLIVSHHPILFRPVQRLTTGSTEGKMLLSLARAGVSVYSPHTAFDNADGGINDLIVRKLGLSDVVPLRRRPGDRNCKVVTFVPDDDLGKVSDALFAAGAGNIGEYSQCSFRLAGVGTFFGSDAANPTIGKKGQREEVNEWRLEVVCPEKMVDAVVSALRQAHSYEEPAYDVYPLRPENKTGEGRVGCLERPTSLAELARKTKKALRAQQVQIVGSPERQIKRVAVVCGSGASFLSTALSSGADVLVTGEAKFHDFLAAQANEFSLILPGHYATERCGVEELASRLQQRFPAVAVWASAKEKDPVTTL